MNFFQLECFLIAAEKNSFAEAASSLHVTQPTITYQITNLEDELDEKLFLRTRRGVEITREGRLFVEHAKKILQQYDTALSHFRHAVSLQDSIIRVGFTRFPDNYDFFAAIHQYRAKNPDCVVDVQQDELVTESTDLSQSRYDVLIHYRYNDSDFADYVYHPLGRCPYYVLLNRYSKLAERESLSLSDLRESKILVIDRYMKTQFQVPSLRELKKVGIEIVSYSNMDQLMYAIADGVGFGIYPAKYRDVRPGFVRVPLTDKQPLEYGLLYHKEHSAAVDQFLGFLIQELTDA